VSRERPDGSPPELARPDYTVMQQVRARARQDGQWLPPGGGRRFGWAWTLGVGGSVVRGVGVGGGGHDAVQAVPRPAHKTAPHPARGATNNAQHVAFFDADNDGAIWPLDTYRGFRRLGFNPLFSALAMPFIHGSFSYVRINCETELLG
jgi:hypothetical protein